MPIDQRKVIEALGGARSVQGMNAEAKAEALEAYLSNQLDNSVFVRLGAPSKPMTVRELDKRID